MTADAQRRPRPKLTVLRTRPQLEHAYILDQLLQWLADRETGAERLVAYGIVTVHADGSVATAFDSNGHVFEVLGALAHLQRRLVEEGTSEG